MKKYYAEEWKGERFGHLVIIDYDYDEGKFVCLCDCGNEKRVKPTLLFARKYVCCGLSCKYHQEQYAKVSGERLNRIWRGMKTRCNSPKSKAYKYYGGRGIKVCEEWESYEKFKEWALNNGYSDDLTIDRINSDGDYEPSNCRWATYGQQRANSRDPYTLTERPMYARGKLYELNGEIHTLPYWCDKYGVLVNTVRYRLSQGHTLEDALTCEKWARYRQ